MSYLIQSWERFCDDDVKLNYIITRDFLKYRS